MSQPLSDMIVNAGCLLFFNDRAPYQDVLDTTLYAQLAASKKHSRFSGFPDWKKTWLAAALYLGWTARDSKHVEQTLAFKDSVTFWSLAEALRPGFISQDLLRHCEANISRLLSSNPAFTLFTEQVMNPGATSVAMQVGVVDDDYDLTLLQLHFDCSRPLSRDRLFGPWKGETIMGSLTFSFHRLKLSPLAYAPLRSATLTALKERRPGLVYELLCSGAGS